MNRYGYTILFALAILVGFLIRLVFIEAPNLYYDEQGVLISAKLLIEEGLSPWDYTNGQPPPLLMWITSISFLIFGVSEFSLRIVETFFGTLTIVVVYFIARQWYDKKVAILASFLLAVSPVHAAYSRLGVNSDIIQTFFLLLAIFVMEYCYINGLKGRKELMAVILSGILFGLSFLAKFNAMIPWGLYWIFIFLDYRKNGLRLNMQRFIVSNLAAFIIIILSTGLILSNIFYLAYGFVYLAIAQSTFSAYPVYYRLLLLVDALSPIVFLALIASIVYIAVNFHKKRQRNDMLMLLLVLGSILITILQPRASAKHFLTIMPFIAISISRFIMEINIKLNRKLRYFGGIIVTGVVASSFLWTVYEIKKDTDYRVWKDVVGYINDNIQKDAVVYSLYPYWPLAHRAGNSTFYTFNLERSVVMAPSIKSIKKGDIFVIGNFDGSFDLSRQGPFSEALEIFGVEVYRRKLDPYPKSEAFISKNAELIKTFYCRNEGCIWIYQMKNVNSSLIKEFGEDERWSFFANEESKDNFFLISCGLIKKRPFSDAIEKLGRHAASAIENKCRHFQ